ncbi:MAG: symmetrical bis(5'-nucleosyl)-tetraphosphatase [Psychrobium sp.]|nr:symmetrical bis(5'-nucleosyl)-tetraphosphatase [Psychrobium sp.]
MATYFIGDVQGCYDEFLLLLKKIKFDHRRDTLYLAGDMIGRGPKSLEMLSYLVQYQDSIKTVLGNHDLHFLAICSGIKQAKESDLFTALLASSDLPIFIDYLRKQPLLISLSQHNIVLSHAGISPQWTLGVAAKMANDVSNILTSSDYVQLLTQMYDNECSNFLTASTPIHRAIFAINALTRMRYCYHDGSLNFTQNCAPELSNDSSLRPWFDMVLSCNQPTTYVFGHWASLMGETHRKNFIALDTGCLWGNHLTAWCAEYNQYFVQKRL